MALTAWWDRTGSDSLRSLRGTGDKIAGGTGALTPRQRYQGELAVADYQDVSVLDDVLFAFEA